MRSEIELFRKFWETIDRLPLGDNSLKNRATEAFIESIDKSIGSMGKS